MQKPTKTAAPDADPRAHARAGVRAPRRWARPATTARSGSCSGSCWRSLDPGNREAWLICAALGPIAIGLNYGIKLLVKRPRPVLEGLPPLGGAPSSLSFPSAHALSSFAVATAMFRVDPATAGALVVALALSLGRPYLGMHYPSDVLAGALLGVVLGPDRPALADEGRDRRAAERGQVDPLQRADQGRRPDRRLPVHDDRAQRRDRRGAGRAAGTASPRRSAVLEAGTGDDRLPRHRRPGQGRLGGGGARQPVPRLDPRDRRDLPRRPLPRRLRRAAPRRPCRPAGRHRDDRDRAGALRLRPGRAPPGPGRQGGEAGDAEAIAERDWLETGGRGARRGQAGPLGPGPRRRRRTARATCRR